MKKSTAIALLASSILAGCANNTAPQETPTGIICFAVLDENNKQSGEVRYILDGKCIGIVHEPRTFDIPVPVGQHEVSIEFKGKALIKSTIQVMKGVTHPVYINAPTGA